MIQQDYNLGSFSQPLWSEQPNEDSTKLIRCFWVFGISCVMAGIIFLFVRDVKIAAGICGAVAVLLSLFHTPFGLFIVFSLLAIENAVVLNPYFTISKAMGLVVLVSFILHMYHLRIVITTPLKLAVILTLWALFGVIWSMLPYYTALACLTFVLNIGLAVIILSTVKDAKSLFLVVSGFALGAFVASAIALSGFVVYQSRSAEEMGRAALSEDTSPVVLALALCLGFLVVFYIFFQQGKLKKIVAVSLLCLIFLAMVKTQSRMPTLAALSIPVIALILGSKRENRLKYIVIACLVGVIAFVAVKIVLQSDLLPSSAKERISGQGFDESGRLQFWKWGFQAFIHRPLHGYGLNNFHLIPTNTTNRSAHNNFVALTTELGLVGLGLMAAIFVILYKQIVRLADVGLKWLGMAFLLYPLVTGITSTTYSKKEFWYVMGIVMAIANIGRLQQQINEQLWYENILEQDRLDESAYIDQQQEVNL